jgi:Nif-specific regulatory protein
LLSSSDPAPDPPVFSLSGRTTLRITKTAKAIRELRALYRVSQAVSATLDLRAVVEGILSILAEELGMQRGTLALFDPGTGELAIEVAHGLSEEEKRRGRYKVGEGIMGRVLERGEPMIIPNIGAEPLFLNRTGARRDIDRSQVAFLCVPVKAGGETVGVLSADRLSEAGQDLEEDLRLLAIVAGVVAQAVRVQQMVRQEKEELADENRNLRLALEGIYRLENLIGTSPAMLDVYEQVRLVAGTRAPVLITGERGTGKELVAKAIHFNSDRADRPFVRLSCSILPGPLLEAEIFGEEAGSRPGGVEQAAGGTLFLDDVGRAPDGIQTRLLRLLRDGEFARAGGGQSARRADVRIVAATTRDLAKAVRQRQFDEDLYFRLGVVPIHLPPLRERKRDIPLLAQHFLSRFCQKNRKTAQGFAPEAMALLTGYDWPGNVRELEDAVERAVVVSRGDLIQASDMSPDLSGFVRTNGGEGQALEAAVAQLVERLFADPPPEGVYRAVMDRVERVLVNRAVERSEGIRLQAARLLGINRNTLYSKLDRSAQP